MPSFVQHPHWVNRRALWGDKSVIDRALWGDRSAFDGTMEQWNEGTIERIFWALAVSYWLLNP